MDRECDLAKSDEQVDVVYKLPTMAIETNKDNASSKHIWSKSGHLIMYLVNGKYHRQFWDK